MLCLIPARGNSKSIPKKNLVKINNTPLIVYTIKFLKEMKCFEKIIVSTEDRDIIELCTKYDVEILLRPPEMSCDMSSDYDYLKHFFENYNCEEVALFRPTTFLRDSIFVKSSVTEYQFKKNNITGFRSVHKINENPYKLFKLNNECICETFFEDFNGDRDFSNLPRQTFPDTFKADGHIDIIKRNTIFVDKSVYGDKIYGVIGENILDIDSIEDLKFAEYLIYSKEKENEI